MSSPFAQKFMGKKPFSDEQYETLAKKYAKKEKEQSVENDAPDYETKMRLQKELAKELEQKKQEGSSSPNQMSPLNRYVSIEPAMQRLQRDAENIAAMDKKDDVSNASKIKNKAKQYSEFNPGDIKLDYKAFEDSKKKNYGF
jgi:exonuclease VII large subunit